MADAVNFRVATACSRSQGTSSLQHHLYLYMTCVPCHVIACWELKAYDEAAGDGITPYHKNCWLSDARSGCCSVVWGGEQHPLSGKGLEKKPHGTPMTKTSAAGPTNNLPTTTCPIWVELT